MIITKFKTISEKRHIEMNLLIYYYLYKFIQVESVQWTFDNINPDDGGELRHLAEFLANKQFDMVINLPMRNGGARRVSSFMTHGYRTRRLAVDYSIPLVTDVKCTKLLVEAIRRIGCAPRMKTHTDCMTSRQMIKLPGFIDVHVHLREPGATHKEDLSTGTAAALAGGITLVCIMPNTNPPIVDRTTFQMVHDLAKVSCRCDYALYVGASSDNFNSIFELAPQAAGLKMYLNQTFSTLTLTDMLVWQKHLSNWPKRAPLVVHAEKQSAGAIILLASLLDRAVHIAHVARKEEIMIIRAAKEKGIKITCEVCPHHLFLSTDDVDRIGGLGIAEVRPVLCSPEDQNALWENLDIIDVFATDHAPHTYAEKTSAKPPPGFPGLETILPLLLNAVNQGRLTLDDLINKFHRNPKKIFNLPEQPNTYVEVDMDDEWIIPKELNESKAKWTPFAGMKVKGSVRRVVLRGEVAFVDGVVLVHRGYGENVRDWPLKKSIFHHSLECIDHHPSSDLFDVSSGGVSAVVVTAGGTSSVGGSKIDIKLSDLVTDIQTNDIYSKLLSETVTGTKIGVHFGNEKQPMVRSISPLPTSQRVRCDSTSNPAILKDLQHTTTGTALNTNITLSHALYGKHILSVDMFTKEQLNDIFDLAHIFKNRVSKDRTIDDILKGKIMASIFYEVSTRTSGSFAAAMQRLGGRVIYMDETSSSVKKGETLEDSIAIMAGYADVVVLRHPQPGAVEVSIL